MRARGVDAVSLDSFRPEPYDIVIEASGNPDGMILGLDCLNPRGTLVLKSTYNGRISLDPSFLVVNEITLLGSRCGRLSESIKFLQERKPDLSDLITAVLPLTKALQAFELSSRKETLKVVLSMKE
jgi:threonine dehydrogenase-like Zn-dependent dehydrogenase